MNRLRLRVSVHFTALILCVVVLSRGVFSESWWFISYMLILLATVLNTYQLLELLPKLFRKD